MDAEPAIDHVAIAVKDLETALRPWLALAGPEARVHREEVPSEGVRIAKVLFQGTQVEIIEPTDPGSPAGRFLERRGEGFHHVALRVRGIMEALDAARAAGLEVVGEAPRQGSEGTRIAFLHPRTTGGVLVELVERPGPHLPEERT